MEPNGSGAVASNVAFYYKEKLTDDEAEPTSGWFAVPSTTYSVVKTSGFVWSHVWDADLAGMTEKNVWIKAKATTGSGSVDDIALYHVSTPQGDPPALAVQLLTEGSLAAPAAPLAPSLIVGTPGRGAHVIFAWQPKTGTEPDSTAWQLIGIGRESNDFVWSRH